VRGQPRMLRRHADRAARIAAVLQPASAVVEAAPNGDGNGESGGNGAGVGNRESIGNGGKGGNGNAAGESRAPAARLERPQGAARAPARIGPEHRRTAPGERGTLEESAERDPALVAALDHDAPGAGPPPEEEPLV
jgi:hypothetical protein